MQPGKGRSDLALSYGLGLQVKRVGGHSRRNWLNKGPEMPGTQRISSFVFPQDPPPAHLPPGEADTEDGMLDLNQGLWGQLSLCYWLRLSP